MRHRQGLSDYGLNSNWRTLNDALHYSTVCKTNVNYAGQPKTDGFRNSAGSADSKNIYRRFLLDYRTLLSKGSYRTVFVQQ